MAAKSRRLETGCGMNSFFQTNWFHLKKKDHLTISSGQVRMTVAVLNLNFVNLPSYKLLICMEISLKVKSKMALLYRNIKIVLH